MKTVRILTFVSVVVLGLASVGLADSSGRIYGTITTVEGDTFKGLIRWDKNEGSWVDVLNGNKELRDDNFDKRSRKSYRDREKSVKIFGITVHSDKSSYHWSNSAQSGLRFGHLKSLEVIDDDAAIFTLKSGERVELSGGSTDIGEDVREIIIEDENEGEIELVWDDIEKIEFSEGNKNLESDFGDRLYGTISTRRGDEFTGYVCWDVDELFTSDILDGSEKGRRRKVKFGKIASIKRYSSSGALVTLTDGSDMLLRESNDVDDGNRGIVISDPAFGQVEVSWDEFEELTFKNAPKQISYKEFDGGHPLVGTVYTEDGESFKGKIRWDNDEEYSWEILDGEYHDIEFDIEFGLIKEISKKSYRSADVTVSDGRTFRLRGSNDVDEDNKGIIVILDDGDVVDVEWSDFSRLELSR